VRTMPLGRLKEGWRDLVGRTVPAPNRAGTLRS
jgi:hypothetical protein